MGRPEGRKKKETDAAEVAVAVRKARDWSQFRGASRDGRVDWLPDSLPDVLAPDWSAYLPSSGIGGIAATAKWVVVGSRDATDEFDLFQGFSSETGKLSWQHRAKATGQLDYGNSPRSTPLIWGPFVYTLGAFGDLSCIDLETGIPLWQKSFLRDFKGKLPDWGFAGSPIMIDEQLVVQPGGSDAALVALDPITGETLWKAKGNPAVYASLSLHDGQLIGMDSKGVVGWKAKDGAELWRIRPQIEGDFGVPSPLAVSWGERSSATGVLLTSENNGTRLHLMKEGRTEAEYASINERPSPDSHTPVFGNGKVYVADGRLYCLSVSKDLEAEWTLNERALRGYVSLIISDDRLLALTSSSELLLIGLGEGKGVLRDRLKLTHSNIKTLSHPAIVGSRFYAQIGQTLMCLELDGI